MTHIKERHGSIHRRNIVSRAFVNESCGLFTRKLFVAMAVYMSVYSWALKADTVVLTASDAATNNSYVNSGGWSDGAIASSGNDYVVVGYTLIGSGAVAPSSSIGTGTVTFLGKSLTIGDGVTAASILDVRWLGAIASNNLTLNKATVQNAAGSLNGYGIILAGAVTVGEGGAIFQNASSTRTISITASLGGTGVVTAIGGNVSLKTAGNTYSGGTVIGNGTSTTYTTTLLALKDGALGVGNVHLFANGNLTLQGGTSNDYIADNALLVLDSGVDAGSIVLSYTGSDTIGGLSFDGGSTYASLGTWGGIGSGAQYESALFAGTGMLTVVPEPESAMMVVIGLIWIAFKSSRRSVSV